MTIHIALQEAAAGRASLDEVMVPPRESWAVNQPPRSSLMFLNAGQTVSLRELLLGLSVCSGNDAAVAVALRFAPSVKDFAVMMNTEAASVGMERTVFVEPSGISEYNLTTALDFATFCRFYLQEHPEAPAMLHSVRSFAYPTAANLPARYADNPGTIVQQNRNHLLGRVDGVDGLKTGYIDEAGYNIALTAERNGTRFIAVVMGAPAELGGDAIRDEDGRQLLEWAFSNYYTLRIKLPPSDPAVVWKGKASTVEVVPLSPYDLYDLSWTVSAERGKGLSFYVEAAGDLVAPLDQGAPVGTLVLVDSVGELRRIPLVTAAPVERGNVFRVLVDSVKLLFRKQ
jgi:D-alanyl-D-alanine carboxypeptidase (penicillin-binding protein 5/6)